MRYFPIFIDLRDRLVVVVGGGEEAVRKVRLLLKTEARIAVIAGMLHEELTAEPRVVWLGRTFAAELLDGAALVYSADARLNETVSTAARARAIPVNAVDDAALSSFIVPSIVDRDPVVVAVGTEGTAPVLALGLRARIDAMLPHDLGNLARAAEGLRPKVAEIVPKGIRRRSFWQRFFFGPIREAFLAGDTLSYRNSVETLLKGEPETGRVTFVSGGNGDPELLTLKAQRKLQEADVIVFDRAVSSAVLELARRDAVRILAEPIGFIGLSAVLIREARAGRHAVRLFSGPLPAEEQIAVAAEGIAIEAVSGVETQPQARILSFPAREPGMRIAS